MGWAGFKESAGIRKFLEGELFKALQVIGVSLVAVIVEEKWELLPVNPLIRREMWQASLMFAALALAGGFQSARHRRFPRLVGWVGLALLFVFFTLSLALVLGFDFGLSQAVRALLQRVLYVLMFLFLGLSVGGFLGIPPPRHQ